MRRTTLLIAVACMLLFCGCVGDEGLQERDIVNTSSPLETTTTESTTTSSSTTATSTSTTTTACSTTTTTMIWDKDCVEYCIDAGYLSGGCQVNLQECQRRLMDAANYRGALCPDLRFDYCCCKTNKSIDRDTCFTFDTIENKYL